MLAGFSDARIEVGDGVAIRVRQAGDGPPVLLLHGYPQTHACWHRVAPRLVEAGFTVVLTDLRGYGGSSKPASAPDHSTYSKRAMAADQVAVMRAPRASTASPSPATTAAGGWRTGWRSTTPRRSAAGGARHRPDRDDVRPDRHGLRHRLLPLVLPDPAGAAARAADRRRPRVLPAPQARGLGPRRTTPSRPRPSTTTCAPSPTRRRSPPPARTTAPRRPIDLEHDAADAGRTVAAPLLALWGEHGLVGRTYDVLATWREKADDVRGHALPTGHYLPEEAPEATVDALVGFFAEG